MPTPSPKEKFTIGIYVTILTIVIIIIWGFLLKYQFKIDNSQTSTDNTFQNIGDSFKQFQADSQEGFEAFKEGLASLKKSDDQINPEIAENFALMAQEELFKKRTADWKIWTYNDFSLKYPSDWEIEPKESSLIILYKDNENISVKVTVNFLDNPSNLTALEWWQGGQIENLETVPVTEFKINAQPAIKISLSNQEIIYVPYNVWLVEITLDFLEKNLVLSQQTDDIIKTINF